MTSEQKGQFAKCCIKLASDNTQKTCYIDDLIKEARKHFPHLNIDTLLKRGGMDEEKLAYTIVGILSILKEHGIEKSIDALFADCKSAPTLINKMEAELDAKAKAEKKPK